MFLCTHALLMETPLCVITAEFLSIMSTIPLSFNIILSGVLPPHASPIKVISLTVVTMGIKTQLHHIYLGFCTKNFCRIHDVVRAFEQNVWETLDIFLIPSLQIQICLPYLEESLQNP